MAVQGTTCLPFTKLIVHCLLLFQDSLFLLYSSSPDAALSPLLVITRNSSHLGWPLHI